MTEIDGHGESNWIHPSAEVEAGAAIGRGCKVWRQAHIRAGASVGAGSIIGAQVYVGADVHLGENCKVQNQALLYEGLTLESGVFVGPRVCFTNDFLPRAVNPDGSRKAGADWEEGRTLVREGAAIGAGTVVITGVTVGRWALVGAGSVVTHDVPDHALVYGSPARVQGWVCECARRVTPRIADGGTVQGWCAACQREVALPFTAADDAATTLPGREPAKRST